MTQKRPYRQRKRAEAVEETRRRIIDATVALHEEVGPRATTIKAIAERAGVQRLTVYRHFPDETAVFQACTSQWLADHPLPDPAVWQAIDDPGERVRAALEAFYEYYGETAAMWDAAWRDAPAVPALHQPMAAVKEYLDEIGAELIDGLGFGSAAPLALRATIGHALAFPTWQSLSARGLDRDELVAMVMGWIDAHSRERSVGHDDRQRKSLEQPTGAG